MGTWRIELLNGLRVIGNGTTLTSFRTHKTGALLGYLSYHLSRTHPREELIQVLWPEDELDSARHKLNVAVSWLRGQLEPVGVPVGGVLLSDRATVRLNPEAVTTDVEEFERAAWFGRQHHDLEARLRSLTQAAALSQTRLLAGYYEEWIPIEQRRLEVLQNEVLEELVRIYEQQGELQSALQYALQALKVDPLREEATRRVMRLYCRTGQSAAAIRQYQTLAGLLKSELATQPDPETRALLEAIRREQGSEAILAPAGSSQPSPERSPEQPTRSRENSGEDRPAPPEDLDPLGGAVPLHSRFYVERQADLEMQRGIEQCTSILVVKGPRQVGKSSLLARGVDGGRRLGRRIVYIDLQALNAAQFQSISVFLQALASALAEQLEVEKPSIHPPDEEGPNLSFRRFLRTQVLLTSAEPVLWALDEVDRLFPCSFGNEVFGLFRSWHNERAFDPSGAWARLTLMLACATEAHLFISDLNQSPFNVGTRLELADFSIQQVSDLNQRYGSPLRNSGELTRFFRLFEGHPYLVRRALQEMAARTLSWDLVECRADQEYWIFADHLRRVRNFLQQDTALNGATQQILRGEGCPAEAFYRLRSAGVAAGETPQQARLRCSLYTRYLAQHLQPE